jgi:hypothetical protein
MWPVLERREKREKRGEKEGMEGGGWRGQGLGYYTLGREGEAGGKGREAGGNLQ